MAWAGSSATAAFSTRSASRGHPQPADEVGHLVVRAHPDEHLERRDREQQLGLGPVVDVHRVAGGGPHAVACSALGWAWIEIARPGASTLSRNGSRGPNRSTQSSPSSPTGSAATTAARSGPPSRSVPAGPSSWAPIHSSDSRSRARDVAALQAGDGHVRSPRVGEDDGRQAIHGTSPGWGGAPDANARPARAPRPGPPSRPPSPRPAPRPPRGRTGSPGRGGCARWPPGPVARVVAAAGEVVEGVGHLDDPARDRHLLAELAHLAVGRGLRLDVVGHRVEPLGVPDDPGPLVGDVALVARRGEHGGAAGDRLDERDLAEVVQQRGVLQVAQVAVGDAEHPADPHAEVRHPLGVAGRGVATVLGEVRQGRDRLPVGHPVPGVAADGDVGDRRAGRAPPGGTAGPATGAMSATIGPEATTAKVSGATSPNSSRSAASHGRALALGAHRRRQHDLDPDADAGDRHHAERDQPRAAPSGRPRGPTATARPGRTPRASQAATRHPDESGGDLVEPHGAAPDAAHDRGEEQPRGDDEHDEARPATSKSGSP